MRMTALDDPGSLNHASVVRGPLASAITSGRWFCAPPMPATPASGTLLLTGRIRWIACVPHRVQRSLHRRRRFSGIAVLGRDRGENGRLNP